MAKATEDRAIYWVVTVIFVAICAAIITLCGVLYLVWAEPQANWNMAERITGTVVTVLALIFASVMLVPTWKNRRG